MLYKFSFELDEVNITGNLIPFGDGSGALTTDSNYQFYCSGNKCVIGIGNFGAGNPFDGTNSLDKGLHVINANPAVVLEDTGGAMITMQAGAGKKFYLKDETGTNNYELFSVNNSDHVLFPKTPRIEVGDGSSSTEIVELFPNSMSDAGVLSFYETSYQNNGLEFTYDSGGNCMYLYNWTGGSKNSTPILKYCRNRNSLRVSNLELLERSSDPSKPLEGETIIWMSNGTGLGSDGDVMIASKVSGTTRYKILFDHSTGTVW